MAPSRPPTITIVPVSEADTAIIAQWLRRPHVRQWWGNPDEVLAKLASSDAYPYRAIIMAGDRKVGFVQWGHPPRQELDDAGLTDVEESAVDIDIMIGEESALGRGIGTGAIKLVVEKVLSDKAVPYVIAATDVANAASRRAFEKAGFRVDRAFRDRAPGDHLLLLRQRKPE